MRDDFDEIMESKRDFWTWQRSRRVILDNVERRPDSQEAYEYYLATYRYTENLRNVLQDLRRLIE